MRWPLRVSTEFRLKLSRLVNWKIPAYVRNDAMRCFHCKDELFTVLERYREANSFDVIAYGVNSDDQGDFRPGQQAARQHHVLAPLLDAGLTKSEIRELARQFGLKVWDKPASACLSSRMEYGRAVTPDALRVIESGEDALRAMGFRQFRVRHHGEMVRIEIAREELPLALTQEMASEFTQVFKALGFKFVTLDTPAMWRRHFKEYYRAIFAEVHRWEKDLLFHSCGNVAAIIPDLIELGVDVLDPLQPGPLSHGDVARQFGGRVAFSGGMNNQRLERFLLPRK